MGNMKVMSSKVKDLDMIEGKVPTTFGRGGTSLSCHKLQ